MRISENDQEEKSESNSNPQHSNTVRTETSFQTNTFNPLKGSNLRDPLSTTSMLMQSAIILGILNKKSQEKSIDSLLENLIQSSSALTRENW